MVSLSPFSEEKVVGGYVDDFFFFYLDDFLLDALFLRVFFYWYYTTYESRTQLRTVPHSHGNSRSPRCSPLFQTAVANVAHDTNSHGGDAETARGRSSKKKSALMSGGGHQEDK